MLNSENERVEFIFHNFIHEHIWILYTEENVTKKIFLEFQNFRNSFDIELKFRVS